MNYEGADGRVLFVDQGLGSTFGTFYRKVIGGGRHRVKSKYLPMRKTREEAQADLDAYAKRARIGLPQDE